MRWLGLVSLVSFPLVGIVVGFRLLRLAGRTRELPELAIGLGLTLTAVVGLPVSAIGRLPSLVRTPLGDSLFAAGLLAAVSGIALLYAFTWQVFRPDSRWAKRGVAFAAAALAGTALGLLHASGRGETFAEILPHTRPWALGIVALVAGSFLWSGIESACYYALLRRRLALDLADPVITNRFLLWAVSGFASGFFCLALLIFILAGMAIVHDPLPLATVAMAGFTSSAAWTLTFLPPESYLRLVRRRAAASRATVTP